MIADEPLQGKVERRKQKKTMKTLLYSAN